MGGIIVVVAVVICCVCTGWGVSPHLYDNDRSITFFSVTSFMCPSFSYILSSRFY